MQLKQTWRWYGPNDPVSLQDVKQTGAQGIVTALHHVPHGEVWTVDEIRKRQDELRAAGYKWDVVESVTIHEDIKTRTGEYKNYIEQYKQTLRNLSACGISIVTYNFMPITDWVRTNLDYEMADGSKALYFNWIDLAIFDIYLLQRKDASNSYSDAVLKAAEDRYKQYTQQQLDDLVHVIVYGIPGEKKKSIPEMRELLKKYNDIDAKALRDNLKYFLSEIAPVAAECDIRLALHPDDPPYSILGIPRIVKNADDVEYVLNAVPQNSNGFCFCTGSFGADTNNDLPAMAKQIGDRIHFVHLRNTKRDAEGNFFEADHLDGDTDMYAVLKEILAIQQRVTEPIPFRPDHGHQMLDDLNKVTFPGYSCIGRMRGLAELRGLEMGICRNNGW
ncbi:MAG TPA: mannonate dehydratase [Chitinophagaceae bacterium]|jgi:mannonate dehydratase|nr:mannonate dehydratase [Chitinophagaceae bacterium]